MSDSTVKPLLNYRLTVARRRAEELAGSNHVKSLRDEIGLLRLVIEQRLNQCQTEVEMALAGPQIAEMIGKVDKLVNSAHRLEGSLGQTLDKQALLNFAEKIIAISGRYIAEERLGDFGDEILAALSSTSSAAGTSVGPVDLEAVRVSALDD